MKIDPTEISHDVNQTISQSTADIQQKIEDNITASTMQQIDEIKNKIQEK
jgi:hypothetical protein